MNNSQPVENNSNESGSTTPADPDQNGTDNTTDPNDDTVEPVG